MMILGTSAGVLFLLVMALLFATRPRYEVMFANLTDEEQASVASELGSMGFDPQFDRPGIIEIPASQKASARIRLAAANKLPHAQGQWGLGELNATHFGETPSVEQERLKAITEGEIAKSIESMEGVSSARVQLTMPTQALFTDEQKPATASITIVENGDSDITPTQGRAIALLVKNAVNGLDTKDIVVVNQHLKTIFNGADEQEDGVGGAERKTEIDESVSKSRQRELQGLLDGAFGTNAAIVTVHADVDMDPSKTVSIQRTPTGTTATQIQKEQVQGSSSKPAGIAGTNGNLAGAPAPTSGSGSGNYSGESQTKENAISEVQTDTSKAIGSIKAMAINVVVDSTRVPDPKAVEDVLIGDLGDKVKLDAAGKPLPNQAFSVKVTAVDFDKSAAKEAVAAEKTASRQAQIQQVLSMLPIGALLLVAAMVLRQVARFARSQSVASALNVGNDIHFPSSRAGAATLPDSASLSNLLAQMTEPGGDSEMVSFGSPRHEEPGIEVEDIKNRVHIPLEQLKKMANERPALVAALIKSMILEERK